jgi:hypothetical protein
MQLSVATSHNDNRAKQMSKLPRGRTFVKWTCTAPEAFSHELPMPANVPKVGVGHWTAGPPANFSRAHSGAPNQADDQRQRPGQRFAIGG